MIALLLVLGLAASTAGATKLKGTSGAQFLKIGSGARAGGMAEAYTALANDAYAAYYNPAGLVQIRRGQLAGAHTAYFEDISHDVLIFAYPFGRDEGRSALAFGVYHLGVGDIDRRVGDSTDPVGTFGASDDAYAVSYARRVAPNLSLGITGKYISQSIDSFDGHAWAGDAGVQYVMNPEAEHVVSLGASVRNVGGRSGYVAGNDDPLPSSVVFGMAYRQSPALKLVIDAGKYRDTDPYGAIGGEYAHAFNADVSGALRAGYNTLRHDAGGLAGLAAGVGINFNHANFDFAWQPFGELGDTFRYSLVVKF